MISYDQTLIKKQKLGAQDGAQVVSRRALQTQNTVQKLNLSLGIYNKALYAGTNDAQNAERSLTQVRNGGATVPLLAQNNKAIRRVNTFFGQRATAGSATKDAKAGLTLDTILPNRGHQNF